MRPDRIRALPRLGRWGALVLCIASMAFWPGAGPAPRVVPQGLIVADEGRTAGDLAPVRSPVAGTVAAVRAADHEYVTAGTVLVALNASRYQAALARAESRRTAARARVRASLAALASQERAASDEVRAAVTRLAAAPHAAPGPGTRPTPQASAAFTAAEGQAAAADARLVQIARAQADAARRTADRDKALLAQGLISAREAAADEQAYETARTQADAAAAALRATQAAATQPTAASGSTANAGGSAPGALAAAQSALDAAGQDRSAAEATLDRDKALLADGAIPANQVDGDTAAYNAASARVDAAAAAVRAAEAHPAAVQTTSTRGGEPRAASDVDARFADRAEATIAEAQRRAQALAAAQVDALNADRALDAAKAALDQTVVRAPVSGWVTESAAAPGQTVQAGQRLMALSIQGRTWVAADVPATNVGKVRVGNPAMVTVDGYRGRVWLGRVFRVDSVGGAQAAGGDQAVEVRIALDSPDQQSQLPGGLPADVAIDTRATNPSPSAEGGDARAAAPAAHVAAASARDKPGDPQLAAIKDREQQILAQLNTESEQIHAIVVGAAPGSHGGITPSFLNNGLAWPVAGAVSSGYGWRIHPIFHTPEFHTGIDIAASWGTPVAAADDGVVIFTGRMTANGNLIIVNHGNGLSTTYSHLSSFDVRVGDRVRRGQVIGRVGSTGWSTGPHLFFEIRKDGQPLDPLEP